MLHIKPTVSKPDEIKARLVELLAGEVKQYSMAVHYKTGLETYYEGKAKSLAQFAGDVFGTENDTVNRLRQELEKIDNLRD